MTNYIIKDNLAIRGSLIVNGLIINLLSENGLNKVENLDTYVPVSGTVDDLVADNLVLCGYRCDLTINGDFTYINSVEYA